MIWTQLRIWVLRLLIHHRGKYAEDLPRGNFHQWHGGFEHFSCWRRVRDSIISSRPRSVSSTDPSIKLVQWSQKYCNLIPQRSFEVTVFHSMAGGRQAYFNLMKSPEEMSSKKKNRGKILVHSAVSWTRRVTSSISWKSAANLKEEIRG